MLLRGDLAASLQRRLEEAAERKRVSESMLVEGGDCSFLIGQTHSLQV